MENAAERMMEYGCRAVLVKGGHRVHDAVDILLTENNFIVMKESGLRQKYPWYGMHAFRSTCCQTGGRKNAAGGCCRSESVPYRCYRSSKRRNHRTGQRPGSSFLVLRNTGEIICTLFCVPCKNEIYTALGTYAEFLSGK